MLIGNIPVNRPLERCLKICIIQEEIKISWISSSKSALVVVQNIIVTYVIVGLVVDYVFSDFRIYA